MSNIYTWSKTAADNSSADSAITWSDSMAPSAVDNSARAMMGRVAELRDDLGGTVTAGGTANALTVTANSAFTTHAQGRIVAFKAASDNTGAATLNVNAIGAKSVRLMTQGGDVALRGGEIQADGIYVAMYSTAANSAAGGWILVNPTERGPAWEYIPAGSGDSVSAAASWFIQNLSAFRKLRITGFIKPDSGGIPVWFRTGTNNNNVDLGASDYDWQAIDSTGSGTSSLSSDPADAKIVLCPATNGAAQEGCHFEMTVDNFNQTAYAHIRGTSSSTNGSEVTLRSFGGRRLSTTARNIIAIQASDASTGGTVTGHVICEGIRG